MLSHIITESNNGLLFTVRLFNLIFSSSTNKVIPYIEVTFGNTSWTTTKNQEACGKVYWGNSHTFEANEIQHLTFRVFFKSGFFRETDIGSCVVKAETFVSRKGTLMSEIVPNNGSRILITWGFIMEDRQYESEECLRLINEVEAEREEIKYFKSKLKQKLQQIKEKSKLCKEALKNILLNIEPFLEIPSNKDKQLNSRIQISAERQKINKKASELLYLKVYIEKELQKTLAHNNLDYSRSLKVL
ncbi:hypothetical protein SteCoe_31269 [Stentor coeruleus]|uniref:C2 domain-containing protein n=1 Tax=Stentor coeruleus TaxID=5963 RepID=A0A1R2B1M2_9CILI|nr:hypothetical protein SteCoe_31269 [Stentor coeruleus]